MSARARPNPTRQIRRSDLEQLRQSIDSWETHGREAGRDGDLKLAAGYAEDMTDLRAILRLIESGELDEATEKIDCLDTLSRDQIPTNAIFFRAGLTFPPRTDPGLEQ